MRLIVVVVVFLFRLLLLSTTHLWRWRIDTKIIVLANLVTWKLCVSRFKSLWFFFKYTHLFCGSERVGSRKKTIKPVMHVTEKNLVNNCRWFFVGQFTKKNNVSEPTDFESTFCLARFSEVNFFGGRGLFF